ncbi:MAG: hypothetical protein HY787_19040 [Deltaproteobacteria bacterium]|nr:hypothetical protein [Deltaproteobacteria bacterium]
MGVDLLSLKNNREAWFNWTAWKFLLNTAREFGWEPMGTVINLKEPPSPRKGEGINYLEKQRIKKRAEEWDKDWDGSYISNDDQIVTDSDAANLLQSLTRSINNREFLASINEDSLAVIKDLMGFLKNGAFRIS